MRRGEGEQGKGSKAIASNALDHGIILVHRIDRFTMVEFQNEDDEPKTNKIPFKIPLVDIHRKTFEK